MSEIDPKVEAVLENGKQLNSRSGKPEEIKVYIEKVKPIAYDLAPPAASLNVIPNPNEIYNWRGPRHFSQQGNQRSVAPFHAPTPEGTFMIRGVDYKWQAGDPLNPINLADLQVAPVRIDENVLGLSTVVLTQETNRLGSTKAGIKKLMEGRVKP